MKRGKERSIDLHKITSNVQESEAAFKRTHHTFLSNCQLSLCVAFWVTLIGVPSFWSPAKVWLFGELECTPADILTKVAVNGTIVRYSPENYASGELIWCGYLPNNYLTNWPNVVQMIVFTVYQNTGTTVMQAWQGFIGTFCAVLNVFVMDLLLPHESSGVLAWVDTIAFIFLVLISGSRENTMKFAMSWHVFFMMTFLNPNARNARGRLSIGIPRLFWDGYIEVVLVTSVFGVAMAVVCTVFPPPPLLSYRKVVGELEAATASFSKIWTGAIEYYCGTQQTARRFVLAEAITSTNQALCTVQSHLANSWWENFDLCGWRRRRILFNVFDTTLLKTSDVMVAVQDSVLSEDFTPSHTFFCEGLREVMESLKISALDLLERSQKACQDGDIDYDEIEDIEEGIEAVRRAQAQLLAAYCQLSQGDKAGAQFVSRELANENEFVFALSVWARKITDFARNIIKVDEDLDSSASACCSSLLGALKEGFLGTWQLPSRAKTIWAIRNFISITFAFWAGYMLPCPFDDAISEVDKEGHFGCTHQTVAGSIFTPFSANMANTLGLLINHYPGSALVANIQRLLGVTLGKVVPLVMMGFINILHSESKVIATTVSIFVFTWLTNYMYYASKHWSLVGCLMAGFGVAMLITPQELNATPDFSSNYKDIAQVAMAILLQIFIDSTFDYFQDDWPRDMANRKLGLLRASLRQAFASFFDGDMEGLRAATLETKDLLKEAQALQHEADPDMQLVACWRTDFKVRLYRDALEEVQKLCSDLTMLILAVSAWRVDKPPNNGNDRTALKAADDDSSDDEEVQQLLEFDPLAYVSCLETVQGPGGVKEELLRATDTVLGSLEAMLEHGSEDNNFQEASKTQELINMTVEGYRRGDDAFKEINSKPFDTNVYSAEGAVCEDPRTKITVAVLSLQRAKVHLGNIEKLMMPYIML